jgi:hypothetical protein
VSAGGVSGSLTVMVASITALSGISGSFVGGDLQSRSTARAVKEQAEAAAHVAASERYAKWQMHKREVYTALLNAIQVYADSVEIADDSDVQICINRALVVAHSGLRSDLVRLREDLTMLCDSMKRRDLVESLMADVRQQGVDT